MAKHSKAPRDEAKGILDSIRRIVRGLRLASRAAEKELGLSAAQLFVLQKLGHADRLSLNELAQATLTHQSSVSVVVARLVERGLVRRGTSSKDGRRLELSLTASGWRFLEQTPKSIQERLIEAIDGLSPEKRRELDTALTLLVCKAGLAGEAPTLFFEDAAPHKRTVSGQRRR